MWQTEAGITPQMCTAHRELRYSSITTIGTTFHIQHRSIQTKVNTAPHTTTQELKTPSTQRSTSNTEAYRQSQHRTPHHNPRTPKKSPRGVQRGRGFTAPLRFFHSFPKQKNQALCQENKNKTKTQSHNKQRKRIRKK